MDSRLPCEGDQVGKQGAPAPQDTKKRIPRATDNIGNRKIRKMSHVCGPDAVSVAMLPDVIYLFKATPIKIPDGSSLTTDKLTWKFTRKYEGPEQPRVLRKNSGKSPTSQCQASAQPTGTMTGCYRHGQTHRLPERVGEPTHLWSPDRRQGRPNPQRENGQPFRETAPGPLAVLMKERGAGPVADTTLPSAQDGRRPERYELKPGSS